MWALGEYLRQFDDPALLGTATYRGPLYEAARDFVAKPLIKNMENYDAGAIVAADTSIWEERQKDKKHFAWSTALAILGLKDFAEVASAPGSGYQQRDVEPGGSAAEKGSTRRSFERASCVERWKMA